MMEPGCYPRVNSSMVQSGTYTNILVALVGKFVAGTVIVMDVPAYQFQTADNGIMNVAIGDGCDFDPNIIEYDTTTSNTSAMVFELVGMVAPLEDGSLLFQIFVVRTLSKDMDLTIYNRMLQVQHHTKYQDTYFPKTQVPQSMVTN